MNYLKNHCWCSDSHWGGLYDCQIIVSLSCYKEGYEEDWKNLIEEVDYFSESELLKAKDMFKKYTNEMTEEDLRDWATKKINKLKPEVLSWLEENVEGEQWCIGSDEYVANNSVSSYSVFFQKRKDAMNFIKTWSKWKKPIHYCQYFTDVWKKLDLETGKYIKLLED